ncbi:MAG: hypothetical protein NTY96_06340 [Bacteroidetes bacterium]|nr:hypothetical protein [Bacteroidota bacterium]
MAEKVEQLIIQIPANPDLVQLRNDFFQTHSSGTPIGEHESPIFDCIDVDLTLRNLSALLKMTIYCCSEIPRKDLLNNILYLDVKGMIAALVFMDQMETELNKAAGIIRSLIHENYSIFEEDISIRELTTALFFLHLIATGYWSAFMDYWIKEPILELCETYKKIGLPIKIRDELYGVQLEYCKAFF